MSPHYTRMIGTVTVSKEVCFLPVCLQTVSRVIYINFCLFTLNRVSQSKLFHYLIVIGKGNTTISVGFSPIRMLHRYNYDLTYFREKEQPYTMKMKTYHNYLISDSLIRNLIVFRFSGVPTRFLSRSSTWVTSEMSGCITFGFGNQEEQVRGIRHFRITCKFPRTIGTNCLQLC